MSVYLLHIIQGCMSNFTQRLAGGYNYLTRNAFSCYSY